MPDGPRIAEQVALTRSRRAAAMAMSVILASIAPIVAATALLGSASSACATDASEGAVQYDSNGNPYENPDFSSTQSAPTYIGALTLGDNFISGATYPYGTSSPMGDQFQDNDYVSFTVPTGDVLSSLYLSKGSTIDPGDLFFVGIGSGKSLNVSPPSSSGLLGYTLVPPEMIGSDILPALGMSDPVGFAGGPFAGATKFNGSLPSGDYTLWLLDGDHDINYKLDLGVSAAPEPATWLLLMTGIGISGLGLRRGRRRLDGVGCATRVG